MKIILSVIAAFWMMMIMLVWGSPVEISVNGEIAKKLHADFNEENGLCREIFPEDLDGDGTHETLAYCCDGCFDEGTFIHALDRSPSASLPDPNTGNQPGMTEEMAAPEFRAAWADAWHNGFLSAAQVTALVDALRGANYNAIVQEVRKCGDAYYDSDYEPRATNIIDPLPFDPLADAIAKTHAAGMELHAWIVTYRIWSSNWSPPPPDHIWSQHPEWAMKNSSGSILDGDYYNLDPGVPGVQDHILRIVKDIISKYDVDGFNFDYIRYPSGYYWGYNDITKQRFFDEYGFWPPVSTSDPNWEAWADYRRRQVSDLVRNSCLEILAIKPDVKLSVDTVGWMGGNPNLDYTQTRQYKEVFQDAKGWMEEHVVDMNILMNYKREYDAAQANDFRIWTDFIASNAAESGRHAVDGQGAYLNAIADSITQMNYARSAGCDGGCTYSYAVTNKDGLPNQDFWDAVRKNLYKTPASTPDMPWKSAPAAGVLFGNVTAPLEASDPIYEHWIYQATVTASGPVVRSALSDATGTYGFLDLPPGTYSVTVSKIGYDTVTYENVSLSAGEVKRLNFDLSDVDDDGIAGVNDCNDDDGTIWSDPGEARDLNFEADKTKLYWNPPSDPGGFFSSLYYDTLRSGSAEDFSGAICLESDDGTDTQAMDPSLPSPGTAFFYLVRADNDCAGEGSLGTSSDGTPRPALSCP